MVRPALESPVERLLLRTYEQFPHDEWTSDFCSISAGVIDLLATHGVVLIGTDAPSIDPQDSERLDAHLAVNAAGLRILEGLVLDDIKPGDYELIALPLKLAGLDASPIRAVLRELP
jgi:arylformamidase